MGMIPLANRGNERVGDGFARIALRIAGWALPVVIVAAPVAIGSVHLTTSVLLGVIASLAGIVLARFGDHGGLRVTVHPLVWVGLAAVSWCLVQVLPLPSGWLAALSPHSARIRADAMAVTGSVVWPSVSLEPGDTIGSLLRFLPSLMVFWLTSILGTRSHLAERIQWSVGVAGIVVVMIGVAHWTLGAERILGFYASHDAPGLQPAAGWFTTFVNANNSAGFLLLPTFLWLGMALDPERRQVRVLAFLAFLVCGTGIVLSGSLGGQYAFIAGAAILMAVRLFLLRREDNEEPALRRGPASILVSGIVFLGVALFVWRVWSHSTGSDVAPEFATKTVAWKAALPLIMDFGGMGAGPGTTASLLPATGLRVFDTFYYVENFLLQVLLDFGIPFGLALLLGICWFSRRILRFGFANLRWLGVVVGLVTLVIQNLADFSFAIPGVAIPAAALLGLLAGREAAEHQTARMPREGTRAARIALVGVCGVVIAALCAGAWIQPPRDLRHALARVWNTCSPPTIDDLEACAAITLEESARHPANHHVFRMGGIARMRLGDEGATTRWFEAARMLCPACVSTQILLADQALAMGRVHEAGLLYWEALRLQPAHRDEIVGHLLSLNLPIADLAEVLSGSPSAAGMVPGYLWHQGRVTETVPWMKALLAIEGPDLRRLAALGYHLVAYERDLDQAGKVSADLMVLFPDAPEGYKLQADIQAATGDDLGSLAMLREARARAPENLALALDEMTVLARLRRFDAFDRVTDEVRPRMHTDPSLAFRYHLLLADRLETADKLADALIELHLASREAPRDLRLFFMRARIYTKLRDFVRAAEEYRQVLRFAPGNVAAQEALRAFEGEGAIAAPPAAP